MSDDTLSNIRDRLRRLAEIFKPDQLDVYGTSHRFVLNDPVSEADIAAFEKRNRVSLPADYRNFLLHVGNGGAGPCYGIHKLGTADDDKPWSKDDWLVGTLSKAFPHTSAWNPVPIDSETGEPDEEALEEIEEEYLDPKQSNGAIPISHHGCNIRYWLVVTGPERGNVWFDQRVDWGGLSPATVGDSQRVTFLNWYLDWLSEAEIKQGRK
jgi:hypothetical protein